MVCSMSHWPLNKEQKEGSGGLLLAGGGSLPARSKDGSVLKGFRPFQPETFALNLLPPLSSSAEEEFCFMPRNAGPPLPKALAFWKSGHRLL